MIALAAILPIALAIEGRTIVAGTQATIDTIGWPRFLRMLLLCGISHYTCASLPPPSPRARQIASRSPIGETRARSHFLPSITD